MTASPALDLYSVALDRPTLIEASAGTGKTWTIAGLYVRLLLRHLDPEFASGEPLRPAEILVVTFTKAATAELRDRIRRRLVEVRAAFSTAHSDDDFCQRLLTHYADHADAAAQALDYAILSFDDAAIFTIHGFCQRVLTERAFDCGTGLDVDVVGDEDELLDEVFADLWRRQVYGADPLWVEFLLAQGEGPATWRQRLQAHLGRPGLQVLAPALGADHALDIARRRYAALAPHWTGQRDTVLRLLADAELKVSHKPEALADAAIALDETLNEDFHWLDQPVIKALTLFGNDALAAATKKSKSTPSHPFCDAVSDFLTAFAQLEQRFAQQLAQLRQQLLQAAEEELRARKQQRKQLGFNDLLLRLDEALAGAQGPRLATLLRANYPAALIDEFQDTDPVQYAIFRRLYEGQSQPIFFVGDPKQAIYAFRGADVFTYLAARAMTRAEFTLATNHRSSPALVQAVNTLFARRAEQGDSFLDPRIRFSPVAARAQVSGGLHVAGDNSAPFHVLTLPATDKKPLSKDTARQAATAATVAEIVRLLAQAARGEATLSTADGKQRPLAAGDIAILVSRHADGAALKAALAEHGISAVRQGQDNIWHTREAEELEHLLAALLEPGNEALVLTALGTTLAGRDAAALYALREDETAWERCLGDFRGWQQLWRQSGFMRTFRAWLSASGAVAQLLRHQDGERRLTNLLHLAELLQVASRRHHTPEALLAWYRQERQAPTGDRDSALLRLESDAARVRIVTIHASKGLEYPVVFCPFLWDGGLGSADDSIALCHDGDRALLDLGSPDFASHQARDYDERFAERLRLLYVAVTRAKWRCYTVWGWVSGMAGPAKSNDPPSASALAWLLHGPAGTDARPLQALAGTLDSAVIDADLHALVAAHGDRFTLRPAADRADRLPPAPAARVTLAARPFPRLLSPRWRLASFSGLTAGQHQERPDYDSADRPAAPLPAPLPARDRFHFPRGANPGTCLHAILEHWDFRDPTRLQQLVRDQLGVHGIEAGWADTVDAWLTDVVEAPMPDGFRLTDIAPERRLPELEFTLPLGALDCATLAAILSDPRHGLPTAFRAAAHRLNFQQVQGYLRGFMDLVFEHAGRWYVLDWKSNGLGFSAEDYHDEALTTAMAEAHYYLQYLLYLTALTRWLRLRLPHFDYDRDIGGALYLFLRGIEPSGRYGIFQHRPSAALIEALESLFPLRATT